MLGTSDAWSDNRRLTQGPSILYWRLLDFWWLPLCTFWSCLTKTHRGPACRVVLSQNLLYRLYSQSVEAFFDKSKNLFRDQNAFQGWRKVWKSGWASSNAARHHCSVLPSIQSKSAPASAIHLFCVFIKIYIVGIPVGVYYVSHLSVFRLASDAYENNTILYIIK